jgi:hypothetical protein
MRSTRSAAAMAMATAIATVLLALGACAQGDGDKAPATPAVSPGDRALLDAARQPLDRAHAVEDITAGRKGDLDQQIDASAE